MFFFTPTSHLLRSSPWVSKAERIFNSDRTETSPTTKQLIGFSSQRALEWNSLSWVEPPKSLLMRQQMSKVNRCGRTTYSRMSRTILPLSEIGWWWQKSSKGTTHEWMGTRMHPISVQLNRANYKGRTRQIKGIWNRYLYISLINNNRQE